MVSREIRWAVLGTVLLLVTVAGLVWLGLRTNHLVIAPDPPTEPTVATTAATTPTDLPTSPSATRPTPTPEPTRTVVAPDPELAAAFAEQTAALGGQYALAWVDDAGIHVLGTPADDIAWSTIKVPLAIAALDASPTEDDTETEEIRRQVSAALTVSDNDAALALWNRLGPPETAAAAVDEVLHAHDSTMTRTESDHVRPPFSPFGQTIWSVTDQARFAAALGCAPDESSAGQVHELMAEVVPDQRWGIGTLDNAHFKGGWGPQPGGGYVARQLGDAEVDGQRYAFAVSARAADGSFQTATGDLTRLVTWWTGDAAPATPGMTCL